MTNSHINSILKRLQIDNLNPMQLAFKDAFPSHPNLALLAPTGSGKTLAFLLPLLDVLENQSDEIQVLIITPTRELAIQIETVFKQLGTAHKINTTYGGHAMRIEKNNFSQPPAVLVGTPGRIVDHINRKNIHLSAVHTLILDEFDKSLEMGFQEDMEIILKHLGAIKKRVLVSATDLEEIPSFTQIVNPERIDFLVETTTESKLKIFHLRSKDTEKSDTLFDLLCSLPTKSTLIFCNHRDTVERISKSLDEMGIVTAFFHGGLEQDERERALIKFRNGSAYYFVTTDLASRGLDIPDVEHVIHYQLPTQEAVYTHRNGRTARQGATGSAYLLLSENDYFPDFIQEEIPVFKLKNELKLPHLPAWKTLYIGAGKKDKINKVDVVGFMLKIGQLKGDELGLITVLDHSILVAVSSRKANGLLSLIRDEKIKGKKVKIGIAR